MPALLVGASSVVCRIKPSVTSDLRLLVGYGGLKGNVTRILIPEVVFNSTPVVFENGGDFIWPKACFGSDFLSRAALARQINNPKIAAEVV